MEDSYGEFWCWILMLEPMENTDSNLGIGSLCWIRALDPIWIPTEEFWCLLLCLSSHHLKIFHIMSFAPRSLQPNVFCDRPQISAWSDLTLNCPWACIAYPSHKIIYLNCFKLSSDIGFQFLKPYYFCKSLPFFCKKLFLYIFTCVFFYYYIHPLFFPFFLCVHYIFCFITLYPLHSRGF